MTDKQFARIGVMLVALGACTAIVIIGLALWIGGLLADDGWAFRLIGMAMMVSGVIGALACRWGFRRLVAELVW